MRKPVTFRFDRELLERARRHASADNRSLTNYVETAVLRALEQPQGADGAGSAASESEIRREDIDK